MYVNTTKNSFNGSIFCKTDYTFYCTLNTQLPHKIWDKLIFFTQTTFRKTGTNKQFKMDEGKKSTNYNNYNLSIKFLASLDF